ncbi:hypothetical protein LTR09_006312 [Extremus antarcticus]|uniref:Rhodopsin domain-containing protein n=1 Tax=Extremus antarcticus TaxID=702011 RepID=A0AAJ0DEB2_9PEZI|nr:hypothetical protein LTR09_006312 [Extremus antarcticus]
MKAVVYVLLLFFAVVTAQDGGSEAPSAKAPAAVKLMSTMPACGTQCFEAARKASPSTKNISSTLCQVPVRDQSNPNVRCAIIGAVIGVLAFLLRIVSRAVGDGTFTTNSGLDDIVMGIALVFGISISGLSVHLTDCGLGRDIWTLPFDHITEVLRVFYYTEILYIIALPLIKISLTLTYLRIFPQQTLRIVAFVVIGSTICYTIGLGVATVVQCSPISYSWTRWDGEHEGTCNHLNAQGYCAASLNILLDLLVVAMPMPILWQMNMNLRKKIMIIAMFAVRDPDRDSSGIPCQHI